MCTIQSHISICLLGIIGLKDGDIEVMWADGMISKVGPQTIFVVGREDDMESTQSSFHDGDEDGDDAASWETVDDNTSDAFEADKEVVEDIPNSITTDGNNDMGTITSDENLNDSSKVACHYLEQHLDWLLGLPLVFLDFEVPRAHQIPWMQILRSRLLCRMDLNRTLMRWR